MVDHDYVSEGLRYYPALRAFPHMIVGDRFSVGWWHFRKSISHRWFADARQPDIGFINTDEASILYSNALKFRGKTALEIGCWRGWSAYQVAAAGVATLDVVDPNLSDEQWRGEVSDLVSNVNRKIRVSLIGGFSPAAVAPMIEDGKRWDFAFIDGDHNGDGPLDDAKIVAPRMEETAMVLFHDIMSPDVRAGLDHFRDLGWKTRIYDTNQIMGVAWRGDVEPADHTPDPTQDWTRPSHLDSYA